VAAFQSGFFTPGSLAWRGASLIDIVPGDMVASAVLLATAALLEGQPAAAVPAASPAASPERPAAAAAGAAVGSWPLSPAGSSVFERTGSDSDREFQLVGHRAQPPAAAAAAPAGSTEISPATEDDDEQQPAAADSAASRPASPPRPPPLLVLQAATSSSHPLRVWQLVQAMHAFNAANPSKLRLPLSAPPLLGPSYRPSAPRVWLEKLLTGFKAGLTLLFFLAIGQPKLAAKLRSGFKDWLNLDRPEYDFDLRFDCAGMSELAGRVAEEERGGLLLSWRQGEKDLTRYLMTMAAGAQQLALKQARPIVGVAHDFELLPPAYKADNVVLGSN
jgi:hypothetical protein